MSLPAKLRMMAKGCACNGDVIRADALARAAIDADHLTEENEKLREALLDLIECKGILTSDKECVINARNLLKEQNNDK